MLVLLFSINSVLCCERYRCRGRLFGQVKGRSMRHTSRVASEDLFRNVEVHGDAQHCHQLTRRHIELLVLIQKWEELLFVLKFVALKIQGVVPLMLCISAVCEPKVGPSGVPLWHFGHDFKSFVRSEPEPETRKWHALALYDPCFFMHFWGNARTPASPGPFPVIADS